MTLQHAPRRKADITGIYPLTDEQQGLLLHARESGERGADPYFSQDVIVIEGDLNVDLLEAAWADAVRRHAALRTDFHWEDVPAPLQVVFRDRPVRLVRLDWRTQREPEQTLAHCRAQLREQGFDLARAADLHVIVARIAERRWYLIWAYHHIAIDGWSFALVLRDVLGCYHARAQRVPPNLPPARPFSDFIAWRKTQDLAVAERYWRQVLADFDAPTPLPIASPRMVPATRWAEFALPLLCAPELNVFLQRERITLSTLCQGLWALLLGRLSQCERVIFGFTVAGRPAELAGAEDIAGLFINTLPLSVQLAHAMPTGVWLRALQSHAAELRQFEHLPLARIQNVTAGGGRSQFDSLLVVENFPVDAALLDGSGALQVKPYFPRVEALTPRQTGGRNHYPLTLILVPGNVPELVFAYDRAELDEAAVLRLAQHARELLAAMLANTDRPLGAIALAAPADHAQLAGLGTAQPCAAYVSVPEQVRRWAVLEPEAIAVVGEDVTLTYGELEDRAARLAAALITRDVRDEQRVAILAERSAAYAVGLLAVWKAGAAFLPLDVTQPEQRLRELLADAKVTLLLTQDAALGRRVAGAVPVLDLAAPLDSVNAVATAAPHAEQTAYIIYTSGSTGKPKGTALSHGALAQYCAGLLARLDVPRGTRFAMVSTIAADLGHTSVFGALASGGSVHMLPSAYALDAHAFARWMSEQAIDVLKIVPSHLSGLLVAEQPTLPARCLVLGGEASAPALLARLRELSSGLRILNHYGPTETTVGVLTHELQAGCEAMPLGRPLPGCRLHVLDTALQPVPIEAVGELYVGGGSLARGYHERADLTAERFVPDPWTPGARLYRTGDRVSWGGDGLLRFLGRSDDQLKVRGHRVELGELAAVIRTYEGIRDAVVVARDARLYAYVTPESLDVRALTVYLQARLPEQLLPTAIVAMSVLPLTANGKLDRRALPHPAAAAADHQEPRNDVEAALAEIWRAVLGIDCVGIHDDFFTLGGDSILNLRVIAAARRKGLRLTPKQVFQYHTIAQLAAVAEPMQAPAAAPQTRDAPLTPIQQWFFATAQPQPHHWNQAIWLSAERQLDTERLQAVLDFLVERHEALRLRLIRTAQGWRQQAAPKETASLVEYIDLANLSAAQAAAERQRLARKAQASLSYEHGPLLRAVHFRGRTGEPDRLLLAAHHLCIDSVSWRVLVAELQECYEQAARGETPTLPPSSASYLAWASRLAQRAGDFAVEQAHWLETVSGTAVADFSSRDRTGNTVGDTAQHRSVLPESLLAGLPAAYRCRTEELMLTALSLAICEWCSVPAIAIELEGHGREPLFDDLDVSQTVGWFTTRYPVRLAPDLADAVTALKAIKQQLRATPGKGLGYGVLRYLGSKHARAELAAHGSPWIAFNYLGRLDREADWLQLDAEPASDTRHPDNLRTQLLDVDAYVDADRLHVAWTYHPAWHSTQEIESLAARFVVHLEALAQAASTRAREAVALVDFPLAKLTEAELSRVLERWPNAKDIYPLAPLQAGILFHNSSEPERGWYVNQLCCELRSVLNARLFERAWREALAAHAVLRTVFAWEDLHEPHQIVLEAAPFALSELDWRQQPPAVVQPALQEFLARDLEQELPLGRAPLMRVTLIHARNASYFVWTRHHLTLDGWSSAQLIGEALERYLALAAGRSQGRGASRPYGDFIAWLATRDFRSSFEFWKRELESVTEITSLQAQLPRLASRDSAHEMARTGKRPAAMGRTARTLSPAASESLSATAKRHQVTLNTLVQAAWALVLSRYCRRDEVVFGITVAGRPSDLAGADTMLGLFINTVPLKVRVPSDASTSLAQWWQTLQAQNAQLREHEHVQLAELLRLSAVPQGALFDTLLVFENYPVERARLDTTLTTLAIQRVEAQETLGTPLTVIAYPGKAMCIELVYRADCFEAAAIESCADCLVQVLEQFAAHADGAPATVALLGSEQRDAYLRDIAAAAIAIPIVDNLVARFARQARLTPDRPAVSLEDSHWTYRQLDQHADRIARGLVRRGVAAGTLVAISIERSQELVAAILGVLKSGAAYVPLDPGAPPERLRYIVQDSGARCLLHDGSAAALAAGSTVDLRSLIADDTACEHVGGQADASAQALAYVIYTSGSTGKPKGVAVTHANVLRLFDAVQPDFRFGEHDVWTLFHSSAFDFSVWEFWGALLYGGRLVVVPGGVTRDQQALVALLAHERVTVLSQTPSAFYRLSDAVLAVSPELALRYVVFGGESLDPRRLRPWFERFGAAQPLLVNMYGITETTVHSTYRPLAQADMERGSVIGRPLRDLRLYILDLALEPVPPGVPGELYLGGAGLAQGYLGQSSLTAQRFVPDPFGALGERLYRSGDIVRRHADGEIEYLGRADQQVKVRGFRIELGEIEAQLRLHPSVRDVAVLARANVREEAQLVAYVAGKGLSEPLLREHARRGLPDYMVPAAFALVNALPLTVNGKVDRRALAQLEVMRSSEHAVAPRSALEAQLALVWEEMLQAHVASVHDDFFTIGGHSLLATKLVARMREVTGAPLAIADLYTHRTIAQLAEWVAERTPQAQAALDMMAQLLEDIERRAV